MKSKTIEIIYLATGSYKQFLTNFFDSVKFFFPGCPKIITVVTDDISFYKNIELDKDVIDLRVHKIVQLPYPFPAYFKHIYVKEYCSREAEYTFYFDADTVFIPNRRVNFDEIFRLADMGVLLSLHPFYLQYVNAKELLEDNNTERDPNYLTYIEAERYDYVIGSMFGGTTVNVLTLCDKIIYMMTDDLNHFGRRWYIPKYMDESYLNSISINNNDLLYIKRQFVMLSTGNKKSDFTFCKQKQFSSHKEERINDI